MGDGVYLNEWASVMDATHRTVLYATIAMVTGSMWLVAPVQTEQPNVTYQTSNTDVLLQAVSVVDSDVVWVGGHRGSVLRTVDGGREWEVRKVPGPDSLQIRDVHGVSRLTAFALAAGPGSMSRIFRTDDGGNTWITQFQNSDPDAFYDCMDFWDERRGLVVSDAVDGKLVIRKTENGGGTWGLIEPGKIPDALDGEGGFAASGTCLIAGADGLAYIGTGVGGVARVFRTQDYGETWSVFDTPIVARNDASGIASIVVLAPNHTMAFGGDLGDPETFTDNVAASVDSGANWELQSRPTFPGAIYGAAGFGNYDGVHRVIALGTGGASWSQDSGDSWHRLDSQGYWAVGMASVDLAWLVGPMGRIVKMNWDVSPNN